MHLTVNLGGIPHLAKNEQSERAGNEGAKEVENCHPGSS
jgi:hypothetical protein